MCDKSTFHVYIADVMGPGGPNGTNTGFHSNHGIFNERSRNWEENKSEKWDEDKLGSTTLALLVISV